MRRVRVGKWCRQGEIWKESYGFRERGLRLAMCRQEEKLGGVLCKQGEELAGFLWVLGGGLG